MISPLYDVAGKAVLVVVLGTASLYAVNCVCELGATWRQCEEEVDEYRKKKAQRKADCWIRQWSTMLLK